jgi:hypothetical protein
MKHRHAEVIKAFVDGIKCQGWSNKHNIWYDITELNTFQYSDDARIKPKPPKEQEPQYLYVYNHEIENTLSMSHKLDDPHKGWAYMGKVRVEK